MKDAITGFPLNNYIEYWIVDQAQKVAFYVAHTRKEALEWVMKHQQSHRHYTLTIRKMEN